MIVKRIRLFIAIGTAMGMLHFAVSLFMFFIVQNSTDGQAGFVWFLLMQLDFPTVGIAYRLLGSTQPMLALVDWWYSVGNNQGPNIRALILIGLFGSLHWFVIGATATWVLQKLCRRKPVGLGLTDQKG
jgi:hypothetical protein